MVLTVLSEEIIAGIVDKYGEVRKLNLSSNGNNNCNCYSLMAWCHLNPCDGTFLRSGNT